MEKEINIAKILKDKPKGTKLYSPIFGEVKYDSVLLGDIKVLYSCTDRHFYMNGKFCMNGECLLFPSKEMRDWHKFAWKKGDVLVSKHGTIKVIFDGFEDDTYTTFKGKYALKTVEEESEYMGDSVDGYNEFYTENYNKESDDAAQTYINTIEEMLDGKLNMETLEIEKSKPEFKDGDIVVTDAIPSLLYSKCIFILKGDLNADENRANSYIFYNVNNCNINLNIIDTKIRDRNIHLATEEEKQRLFDALAKNGKAWDAEKKQIVDLKPKVELKPFDKVLVRDNDDMIWCANIFSHMGSHGEYVTIGLGGYHYCIPYNEETAKLIGTTDNWER